jgi:flagellar biogenesis protein FliO
LARFLRYLSPKEVSDMYIGGGVIAVILIILLLIWIF